MRKLEIGFSKPKNNPLPIFSWLIRLYERVPYSHVYIRWETNVGPHICYHAAHTSLHFLSDNQFAREVATVESFEFDITPEQYNRLLKYCLETCGQKYALWEVLMIPLVDLFKLSKNPFSRGSTEQYCAELVLRSIGEMSQEKLTYDADRVKLRQVYQFVKEKHTAGATL
jgi:hypothetical protein